MPSGSDACRRHLVALLVDLYGEDAPDQASLVARSLARQGDVGTARVWHDVSRMMMTLSPGQGRRDVS